MTEVNEAFWPLIADIINGNPPKAMTGEACGILREKQETVSGSVELIQKYREYSDVYNIPALMEEIEPRFLKIDEVVEAMFGGDLPKLKKGDCVGMRIFKKLGEFFLISHVDDVVAPVIDACIDHTFFDHVEMLSYLPDVIAKNEGIKKRMQIIGKKHSGSIVRSSGLSTGLLKTLYHHHCGICGKPKLIKTETVEADEVAALT